MCNHSQVTSFDGQEFCNLCNEELNNNTGISLSEKKTDEDDNTSEESARWDDLMEQKEADDYSHYSGDESSC